MTVEPAHVVFPVGLCWWVLGGKGGKHRGTLTHGVVQGSVVDLQRSREGLTHSRYQLLSHHKPATFHSFWGLALSVYFIHLVY